MMWPVGGFRPRRIDGGRLAAATDSRPRRAMHGPCAGAAVRSGAGTALRMRADPATGTGSGMGARGPNAYRRPSRRSRRPPYQRATPASSGSSRSHCVWAMRSAAVRRAAVWENRNGNLPCTSGHASEAGRHVTARRGCPSRSPNTSRTIPAGASRGAPPVGGMHPHPLRPLIARGQRGPAATISGCSYISCASPVRGCRLLAPDSLSKRFGSHGR